MFHRIHRLAKSGALENCGHMNKNNTTTNRIKDGRGCAHFVNEHLRILYSSNDDQKCITITSSELIYNEHKLSFRKDHLVHFCRSDACTCNNRRFIHCLISLFNPNKKGITAYFFSLFCGCYCCCCWLYSASLFLPKSTRTYVKNYRH